MTQRRTQSAFRRGGAALTAAIALSAAASQPVQANDVIDEIGHFIECFGWMLTDPATHVANCNPGTPEVRLESLATPLEGPTFVAVPASAPTEEEPEEEPGGGCTGSACD